MCRVRRKAKRAIVCAFVFFRRLLYSKTLFTGVPLYVVLFDPERRSTAEGSADGRLIKTNHSHRERTERVYRIFKKIFFLVLPVCN